MTAIRYIDVAAVLARRIAEGRYPVGAFMPTEKELTQEFNTSRHTIRAALRQLQDARLVSRRRGSGTVVEAKTSKAGFSQSLSSLEDLIYLAASSPRHLLAVKEVVADLDMAQALGVGPGTRWLRFTSTRFSEPDNPMGLTYVYVDVRYEGIKKITQHAPERLISELIEEHYGLHIVSVKQDISACALPAAVAKVLKAEADSPGLLVLRHYRDAVQNLIVVSTSYHPAGRYTFSTMLTRQK